MENDIIINQQPPIHYYTIYLHVYLVNNQSLVRWAPEL